MGDPGARRMQDPVRMRWGKSEQGGDGYHLLAYHMLDVAAVMAVALERRPDILATLAGKVRLPSATTRAMVLTLTALHDLGKCALAFQAIREDIAAKLGLAVTGIDSYDSDRAHHSSVGQALLLDLIEEERVALPLDDPVSDPLEIEALFAIFSGHHGFQPPLEATLARYRGQWRRDDKDAAAALVQAVLDLFAWRAGLPDPNGVRQISYLLNGLVTICDWLGSSAGFNFESEPMALSDYWQRRALPAACKVVDRAGVALFRQPARPRALRFCSLFPDFAAATPLQKELERVLGVEKLPEGSLLVVIEDLTGAGKTEAADLLAHRLLAAGRVDGVYYGLPTMATADAAWERKEGNAGHGDDSVAARMFGRTPARVLAHAKRHRNPRFRDLLTRAGQDDGEAGPLDWLTRSSKRALLAELGIGTVDQALIGGLRTRHATVRLAGLWRKLLVVDEVHAYDDYMQGVLEALLRHQAMLGQSVLLMSATLPSRLRARLIRAFGEGAGWPDLDSRLERLNRKDLPLLGLHHAGGSDERPLAAARRRRAQPLLFRAVHSETEIVEWLIRQAQGGRSAIWFRNTVDEAITAFERLCPLFEGQDLPAPVLYHARFLPTDRANAERSLLEVVGKSAEPERRRGRVIIATQAAEQSLDLDVDELASDLAPVDVMIQRLGRRRRHPRNADGSLAADGIERRPSSEVLLHMPALEPVTEDWFKRFSRGAAAIYEDAARLWLTARHLLKPATIPDLNAHAEGIVLERDTRALLESVYDEDEAVAAGVPNALRPSLFAVAGSDLEDRRQAFLNRLPFQDGLLVDWNREAAVLAEEDWAPTRLGDSYELLLAVADNERFRFLEPGADPLEDSGLRVPWPLETDPADADARKALAKLLPDERARRRFAFRRVVVLCPHRADTWTGRGLLRDRRGQPRSLRLRYSRRTGFQRLAAGEEN
jgi:CRISPR-associated endonuclease/helicase Cas3